ncbi:MAG: ribokinase [Burkholderiaceae bacterium]|nr:ribokinase [Burkholderiaceae bacterium]
MKPRISVVGSVNMDLVFRTPRLPVLGETLQGHEFRQIPGGKGANQAVAAARQGAHVDFIGAVGDDGFGEFSRSCLQKDAIALDHLVTIANTATGVAGILVEDAGDNCIVLAAGANARLSTAHIDAARATITKSQFLICQLETPLPVVTHAIRIARELGVKVILNTAPVCPLDDRLLAQVDYLILNETEASQLSGITVTDQASAKHAAQNLLQRGVGAVLLTMGENGALIATSAVTTHSPAMKVKVVDTTAAGDTFVGAFAVGLANGLSLIEATREAQFTAALTVTKLGAQTSIPHRAEVLQFMATGVVA